ncbi:Sedoheptulose 1,7-bisphosphatase [Lachnellula hyalina]|uniref:Sedoheptulose 1,7-bisphosphatase n=1 Tax=Lachnellula hyalina TaxID=1316788 RepID=A0A8H8R3F7_9HELO|nr:Sedoheptulose 1,7-bisphosphatase [Lachnellula hyalina]TVY27719.1 Sedoheptulose 1,7-bisphosphatase [Lachnellula hyalina]
MLLGPSQKERLEKEGKVTVMEDITEWDCGDYEGLKPNEIHENREKRGLPKWDIWTQGCVGGESAEAVQQRLDRLIGEICKMQIPHIDGKSRQSSNVLIVAHGHILRAFTKRWLLYAMDFPFIMMMELGAIGILSYAHHNVKDPAILVGMAFPQAK